MIKKRIAVIPLKENNYLGDVSIKKGKEED